MSQESNFVPAGHFYSPVPRREEAAAALDRIDRSTLPAGITIDDVQMVRLWRALVPIMQTIPFGDVKGDGGFRYHFVNDMYSYGDASVYYAITSHFAPKRIIEIGSGYSSALALDMRELFSRDTDLTFIEPYPRTLNELLSNDDRECVTVLEKKVQDVPLSLFETLQENDILFIDSSHVAKTGSDVCFEIFEILPRLNPGVIIHFHDCFWPFEYPRAWAVDQNRAWNELYFLRAFLMYNPAFCILFFNHYFALRHPNRIAGTLVSKNPGGGLWLRKNT